MIRVCARGALLLAACCLAACATPPAVKEALVSMDEGYVDNAKLMDQYRDLVVQVNERHKKWFHMIDRRALLGLSLDWLTLDPRDDAGGQDPRLAVDLTAAVLGADLVKLINENRLRGLPARAGRTTTVFLRGGDGNNADSLIARVPAIVHAIEKRVDERYKASVQNDLSGFDDYKTNLAVLRRVNSTVKRYLDIDVSIKPEDVDEVAKAIRQLR